MTPDRTTPVRCRHRTALAIGAVVLCGLFGACSSSSSSRASEDGANESTATTALARSMRGERYCEVLLINVNGGMASAEVWNTYPLNDCPQVTWDTLDPRAIAAVNGVPLAKLNGPRYWLMNSVEKAGGVTDLPKKEFGRLEMYRQATVDIGALATATMPYTLHPVNRSTVFVFDAGERIYELRAPDGTTFVMQTYSVQIDPSLTEAQLADLGARLALPPGWTYSSRVLDTTLRVVTTTTAANVLQDELGNAYSQVTG